MAANLAGGWFLMWLIMEAFPQLHGQTIECGAPFALAPLSMHTLSLAVLGAMAITLMTRTPHGTDAVVGKVAAAVAIAFVLAGLQLFHSILDSLLIFGALVTGKAPFGYFDWLSWFGYNAAGNVLGGLALVTVPRLLRSKERPAEERDGVERSSSE